MEYFVVYDLETGAVRWRGQGPVGTASMQDLPEGLAAITIPQTALLADELDLGPIRAAMIAAIDARAEGLRQKFLTPGAGQAMTYLRKEAEARAWSSSADPADFPFLSAEATATGATLAAIVAEVLSLANGWVVIGSQIDAIRISAKQRVRDASDLLALIAAGNVDWSPIEAAVPA